MRAFVPFCIHIKLCRLFWEFWRHTWLSCNISFCMAVLRRAILHRFPANAGTLLLCFPLLQAAYEAISCAHKNPKDDIIPYHYTLLSIVFLIGHVQRKSCYFTTCSRVGGVTIVLTSNRCSPYGRWWGRWEHPDCRREKAASVHQQQRGRSNRNAGQGATGRVRNRTE